jgi:nucleoside-diphosphate-sugar epimerase
MKAFVTGGTGFVGSHLVEALTASSAYSEVKCLVRSSDKWLTGMDFTRVKGDLFDLQTLTKALSDVDTLFHVAGITKAPQKKEFTRANVDATENLIRIAQKKGIKNIVVLSSLAAAGPSSGAPLNENSKMKPISLYGESKKEMEDVIHQITRDQDSIKIIRPPAVYGPREADIYTYFKAFNRGISPVIGNGNHPTLSLVYVTDLIDGIIKASQKTEPGVHTYFMGGHKNEYSWNQIGEVTSIVLNKKVVPIKLKPDWVKKIATVVETGASVFGKYPVLNKEKAKEMVHEWVCSSDKASKELGYAPSMDLQEGIARTIHWYKKHNWL